ncbi:cell surface protein, partial [Gemella cuniculi]
MKYKDKVRKLFSIFLAFSLIITMFNGLITNNRVARAEDVVRDISTVNKDTQVYQEGCDLVIKTTQQTEWSVPRKPIDLVILQDASGSFKDTIGGVKEALKTLTTPVEANQYDPDSPRLVFTDKAETSDRVMVASYQGLDGYRVYDDSSTELTDMWWDRTYGSWINGYRSDTNFQGTWRPGQWAGSPGYTLNTSELTSDTSKINNFIDSINTYGGTPTVPAIEDFIKKYKEAVDKTTEKMNNERKTVFLLITDGVANGVRLEDGKVVIQYSGKRAVTLLNKWGLGSIYLYPESSSNILARANELKSEGEKLRQAVGDNGSVVVGFWEDVKGFQNYAQYGTTYLEGFKDTGVDIGDNRSVQAIFSEALRSVASPDKEVNGKPATFYVNEQNDIKAFADKVLAAVGNALVKENVKGDFTITEGYKVKTVSINGKQIVKEVTDKEKQIRGEVTQEGNKVTISVPDAAFNPGHNKFDYELVRTEGAPESGDEEDEQTPPDGYTPGTVEREVGQLVGRFSVGNYQTAEIGSREANKVQVNSLEYCYPNAVKTITDKNKDNDQGSIKDPILTKRDSYAANLDNVQEEFSYKVDYRMNNIPLNMEKNAMLVDPVNYRLEVLDAYVTDTLTGEKLTNFEIRKVKDTDPQTNKERTIV